MFLKFCVSQIVHFSNIAILKCSNSQIQHFSNSTFLKWSNSQIEHFSNGAILKWSNSQIEHFSKSAIWVRHHQLDDSLVGQLTTPLKSFTKYMRCYLEKYTIWLICMYLDSYCITVSVRSQCISLSEIILHLNPVRLSLKNPMGSIPEYWLVAVVVTARSRSTPFLDNKKSASSFY